MSVRIITGDCRDVLKTLPDESAHCVVTSPPYFGLRDYGVEGQIGLEATPDAFVAEIVAVFREVRRVLRSDGVLWLNLGDSYANDGKWGGHSGGKHDYGGGALIHQPIGRNKKYTGLKPKDLIGIPWRVAFALQADGWWLRQDIIWSKPNPMPESVTDRCTKAHEYLFLLSKSERYFYDADAIKEAAVAADLGEMDGGAQRLPDGGNANGGRNFRGHLPGNKTHKGTTAYLDGASEHRTKEGLVKCSTKVSADPNLMLRRNRRSVWTVATQPFSEAHFATFPPALIEPCIKAGCPEFTCPHCGTGLDSDTVQRVRIGTNGIHVQELRTDVCEVTVSNGSQSILQPEMSSGCASIGDGSVLGVRTASEARSEEQTAQVLLPGVLEQVRGEKPAEHEGMDYHVARIPDGDGERPSSGIEGRLRIGTSADDGEDCRSQTGASRGRSSQERRSSRQSAGKSGTDDKGGSRQTRQGAAAAGHDRMPALSRSNSSHEPCPHCKGALTTETLGRGVVLDPFGGAGTTGLVADRLGRDAILVELNPDYAAMTERRIRNDAGLLAEVAS